MKIIYILLIMFLLSFVLVSAKIVCTTKASCSADEIGLFRMSSLTNAHAQTMDYSSYPYVVCCKDDIAANILSNSCTADSATVLRLSSGTNAQVESGLGSNYANEICLSASNSVQCTYGSQDCSGLGSGYECVATLSSATSPYTNSHVAGCPDDTSSPYQTNVCCSSIVCSDVEICDNALDDDCDGFADCSDSGCSTAANCNRRESCNSVPDCTQDECVSESCVNNQCVYTNRPLCSECGSGQYCNYAGGDCVIPEGQVCYGTGQGSCCGNYYCSHGVDGDLVDGLSRCCLPGEYWDPNAGGPGIGGCRETELCYPEPTFECGYDINVNQLNYFNDLGCFRPEITPYERSCCLTDIYGDNEHHYIPVIVY